MYFEEALKEARKGKMIKRKSAGRIWRAFKDGYLCDLLKIDGKLHFAHTGYPLTLQAISADDWCAIELREEMIL